MNAFAQSDYSVDSTAWNGLSRFVQVAKGLGFQTESNQQLRWKDIGSDSILVIIYPRSDSTHLRQIATYVRNGGSLLIADDFGNSRPLFTKLGIKLTTPPEINTTTYYKNFPFAPIATPQLQKNPISQGIDEVVTNFPALMESNGNATVLFSFAPSYAHSNRGIVAINPKKGNFIAISDPSIFINRMLSFEGNLQLAINALRFLNRNGPKKRVVFLTGDFYLQGHPAGLTEKTEEGRFIGGLNYQISTINDLLITKKGSILIIATILFTLLILIIKVFPHRKYDNSGSWTQAKSYSSSLRTFFSQSEKNTFPSSIFRELLSLRLCRFLGEADPLRNKSRDQIAHAIQDKKPKAVKSFLLLYKSLVVPIQSMTHNHSEREFQRIKGYYQEFSNALEE